MRARIRAFRSLLAGRRNVDAFTCKTSACLVGRLRQYSTQICSARKEQGRYWARRRSRTIAEACWLTADKRTRSTQDEFVTFCASGLRQAGMLGWLRAM